MTQENVLDGSECSNRSSGKRDRFDEEDAVPFKKRVRFLSSDDLKEVTSGLTDAREENKMEIITSCKKDDFSSILWQLATSESGSVGNEPRGDKELIHTAAGGSGSCSQTGTTAPATRSGQIIENDRCPDEIQEAAMNDGAPNEIPVEDEWAVEGESDFSGWVLLPTDTGFEVRGSERNSEDERHEQVQITVIVGEMTDVVGDEEHIGGTKHDDGGANCSPSTTGPPVDRNIEVDQEAVVKDRRNGSGEEPKKVDEKMIQDVDACGKDKTTTDGSFTPTNTVIESNNGGNGEGKHARIEDDGLINNGTRSELEPILEEGEIPVDYVEISTMIHDDGHDCGDEEQAQEPELVTNQAGDHHEQGQLAVMEDGSNDNITRNKEPEVEDQSNKEKEPVEADHHEQAQLDCVNENIRNGEPQVQELINKGKELVLEANPHGKAQQQTVIEDGGDGNVADFVSGQELQDRKGKKSAAYVEFRKDHESGAYYYGGSSKGDHNDPIQETVFEDPGSVIGDNNAEYMSNQSLDMQTQQDLMATLDFIRKRARSIHEQGDGDTPRKKRKFGNDVGITSALCLGYKEPPIQQANHSIKLFGVTIPCEQEPDTNGNLVISNSNHSPDCREFSNFSSPPTSQQTSDGIQLFGVYMSAEQQVQLPVATRGVRLFGVRIDKEQVQSVGMRNRDRGNNHGGGESSMQQPRCGLRLFGFDI